MEEIKTGGWLEVICGPMFSGKTEELMRRLRRAQIAQQKTLVFKPKLDTRSGKDCLKSHDNQELKAICIEKAEEILERLNYQSGHWVIGIDEVQFFSEEIIRVCSALANQGHRIIVSGLDSDYQRQPFGPVSGLIAQAEYIDKLRAVCFVCGQPASFTKRISGGEAQIEIGDQDKYQATCRKCFDLPVIK